MKRRTFLGASCATFCIVTAMEAVAKRKNTGEAQILGKTYPYYRSPEMDMDLIVSPDQQRVGFLTNYKMPEEGRIQPGAVGVEVEWLKDPRDLEWARDFYPDAFR